jgi:hypothetical protein
VTFYHGPLPGRTVRFKDGTAEGMPTGETAFLTRAGANEVARAWYIAYRQGASEDSYALYELIIPDSPGIVRIPKSGTATYVGPVIGSGFGPGGSGEAAGALNMNADFDTGNINGSVNGLTFKSGGTPPNILFSADYDKTTERFTTNSMTFDGGVTTPTGHVEGLFGNDEVAGVISATGTDGVDDYHFTGAFEGTKQ